MLKDIHWKFVAVVVILAMAVSLLSGGLSGVGFGTLMLRAIIGGVVFACLAVGLNILILRLFPEILDFYDGNRSADSTIGGNSEGDGTTGTRVDIVMPAESPGAIGSESAIDGTVVSAADENGSENITNSGEFAGDGPEQQGKSPMGDLDRFSSDFSDVDDDKSPRTKKTGDGIMEDHDVEELAQAVHTVMTRDEKG